MATYNLGQVGIVNKGAWNSSTNYALLNTVTNRGGSFLCIAENSNVQPGVTSGWETYWVALAKGVTSASIAGVSATTARATITYSDGTTETGTTFNTSGLTDGQVTTAKIADLNVTTAKLAASSVTAEKLGSDILPSNVGIKYGTSVPTTSDISEGQIYLKYS